MMRFDGEYEAIPEDMRQDMKRYVLEGRETGDFLTAVICNDLRQAVSRADLKNLPLLQTYVRWFYSVAPSDCSGSVQHMRDWIASVKREVA